MATALVELLGLPSLSPAERAQAERELAALRPEARIVVNLIYAGGDAEPTDLFVPGFAVTPSSIPITPPASRGLAVAHVQQKSSANDTRSGYYCGPATAYMMLKFLGYSTSKHNSSHSLTQDRLASSTYLNTITVKATKWDSKVMETGIKAWTKDALRYRQINAPTVAVVKGKLINRIGRNGQPFAADTVEFTGGKHYNGHPNRTIGHWIAAKGYTNSGNTATWVDPAIPRFLNNDGLGKTSFSEPTSSFTADYLQSNGILG